MQLFMAVPMTPSAAVADFGGRRYRRFIALSLFFIRDYLREFSNPNGILRCPWDTDLWKKPEVENLVSDSL